MTLQQPEKLLFIVPELPVNQQTTCFLFGKRLRIFGLGY